MRRLGVPDAMELSIKGLQKLKHCLLSAALSSRAAS